MRLFEKSPECLNRLLTIYPPFFRRVLVLKWRSLLKDSPVKLIFPNIEYISQNGFKTILEEDIHAGMEKDILCTLLS